MHIQRRLIRPALQKHQFFRVYGALEYLELFAAGLFDNFSAARFVQLRELGASSRCRGDSYKIELPYDLLFAGLAGEASRLQRKM